MPYASLVIADAPSEKKKKRKMYGKETCRHNTVSGGVQLPVEIAQGSGHVASCVKVVSAARVLLKVLDELRDNTETLQCGVLLSTYNTR